MKCLLNLDYGLCLQNEQEKCHQSDSPCWVWAPCWGLLHCLKLASGWWRTQRLCPGESIYLDQRRRRSARRRCPAHCAESDGWASTCSCRQWGRGKWCCPPRCAGDWRSAMDWAGPPLPVSQTGRNPSLFQKTEACSWRSWAVLGPLTNWTWSNLVRGGRYQIHKGNQSNWFLYELHILADFPWLVAEGFKNVPCNILCNIIIIPIIKSNNQSPASQTNRQ